MAGSDVLSGRCILVVEDEYLMASSLIMEFEDEGATTLGPVSNVEDALSLISQNAVKLDAAVLDINLRGTMAFEVADRLSEAGIPFVFLTGYQCDTMPERFILTPCLNKPCDEAELIAVLATLPTRHGEVSRLSES